MKYELTEFLKTPKKVDLCDAKIDSIVCSEGTVRFTFSQGFSVITNNEEEAVSSGYVELSDCDAENFTCYIIHRESTRFGARLSGEPLPLTELAKIVNQQGREIEVFLELYDFNYLYWRGTLLPNKEDGLSDHVVIEAGGNFTLTYYWE